MKTNQPMATMKEDLNKKFREARPKSYAAYLRAQEIIPAGVMSRARLFSPFPVYIQRGRGSKIIDLDGNEIIDCAMGYGPLILGHAHPAVTSAMREALDRGIQYGIPHEGEYRLARLIVDMVPSVEKVSFCSSGTEALYQAIRIGRAVSGKKKIAKFEGGYHGGTNEVLANFKYNKEKGGAVERPNTVPVSIGVPPEHLAHTIVLPYNHEAAFDIIEQNKNELALILVEVIQGMGGNIIGKPAFIQKLRKITRELRILLIVDEVITGFRVGLGGGQVMYDIDADLSTYGKIMGGGTPSAAVGGRAAIMDAIAYTGNPDVDGKEKPFWGGTLNGNPLSMVAGAATLEYLTAHPEIYPEMERLGRKLREKVNEFCRKEGFPVQMTGTSSMFCTHFVEGPIESVRDLVNANTAAIPLFYTHLINEGVFIPNNHMGFISAAHTEADVDKMIGAHCRALQKVREMGAV